MRATERVVHFISTSRLADFPAEAVPRAKKAVADTVAAMVAGARSEVAGPLRTYVGQGGPPGRAPIVASGLTASPETAALVNGTFAHALDYDDVLSMMPAHPSAVILAATFASLAAVPQSRVVTGSELLEAYLVGIEVGGKIGLGMTVGHYHRGYHATGTLALFAGLAALLRLHRVEALAAHHAFGIAASMASGLRCNFGTMTKPLHTGLAARSALTAWQLATSGFTAALDAFEAPAGLFSTLGVPDSDPTVTAARLGKPFVIVDPGLALKKFPCCYAAHRAMDGVLRLRGRLGCDAHAVERLICRMPPGGMQVLTYPRPVTGLEAKFSLPYALAAGLLDGGYSLETFTDPAVARPEIRALYERIDAHESPGCRGDDPAFEHRSSGSRGHVKIELRLRDGRRDCVRIDQAPGAPGRELSWQELQAKFMDCWRFGHDGSLENAAVAIQALERLEETTDMRTLLALLR